MENNDIKVSNIDEGLVDIINELVSNGFKPWASCDGIKKNHTIEQQKEGLTAYIAFLKSNKILELLSAFKKDKYFELNLGNSKSKNPRMLYGNIIDGNEYGVYFENLNGEYTEYFEKIINYVIYNEKLPIDEDINNISSSLENISNSKLSFNFQINTTHPAYYNTDDKIKTNCLIINTKEGYDFIPNINEIMKKIIESFELTSCDYPIKDSDNFVFCNCYIFSDNIKLLQNIMNYCLEIEPIVRNAKSSNL